MTASVASLIYRLTQGQQRGFGQPVTLAALTLAVLLAVAFVVTERRVAAPMVPFQLLADPRRRVALAVQLLVSVAAIVVALTLLLALVLLRPRPGSC
ncbi:MAG TPA: hypothetical protein VI365_24755 [Trebonia sp.]